MAALKPEIIRDCIELIDFYKKNPAFRKRLDSAVKRNINVTYKHRPIKLYFEILAQANLPKYKTTYQQIRRITLHDSEGLISKTFLEVTPKDLSLLSLAASNTEKNINSTDYPDQEIEEINQIEETAKDQVQKTESYQKRLDATLPSTQVVEAEKTPSAPSLPNISRVSSVQKFISSPTTFIKTTGAKISSKLAAGKALAAGTGQVIKKLGLGTAIKAGTGILAKLGISAATGLLTGGVGFVAGAVVTLATTFGNETKKLFKLIFWITIGLIVFIIFMFVAQRGMKMNSLLPPYDVGQITEAPTTPPTVDNPLVIIKSTDKSAVDIGENIEFTLKVEASLLAGNKIIVRDKIPNNTTFVSASDGGVLKGDTIEWNLDAVKSPGGKRIPIPQTGPPPAGSTLPLQRITANEAQIRADLEKNSPEYAKYAKAVFDAGKEFNVDPAFIMAIWWGESHYSKVGGLKNNPGSIVYVRDGYLGMKKGTYMNNRTWATWDTFEAGIKAIAELIATEYYSQGQTDTWKVHSGKDDSGTHAYHCRCDIGKGYGIDTWEDYVNFYYNWLETMSRVSGGSGYYLAKDLHLIVRADTNNSWIINQTSGFAPGAGEVNSNQVFIKVGSPLNPSPEEGGSPTKCAGDIISFAAVKKLLPLPEDKPVCKITQTGACGRPGDCVVPNKIVLHVTGSNKNTQETYKFFADGAPISEIAFAGTGSQFVIDKNGSVLQLTETFADKVEKAYAVQNYSDHISIEMVSADIFSNKRAVPEPQYQATINLVKSLMDRYRIPLGNLDFDWKAPSDSYQPSLQGIFGHYQLNPIGRSSGEPGPQFIKDFRNDLKK